MNRYFAQSELENILYNTNESPTQADYHMLITKDNALFHQSKPKNISQVSTLHKVLDPKL